MAPYLKPGDTIGIVSTASLVSRESVEEAKGLLEELGFKVQLGNFVYEKHGQFAGSDIQRSMDLQKMMDDPAIKAIVCSRGGYGTMRTLENIDWHRFKNHPKWIVGFSDVTVLHAAAQINGFASLHGVMPRYFMEKGKPTQSFKTLTKALLGEVLQYKLEPSPFNKKGKAEGILTGGNLSILYSLRGTPYDLKTNGKILFIEELSEYLYHLDRMMMNLKTGGKLENLNGMIVGGLTGMKDHQNAFGKTAEEIILDAVSEYNYPVIFNFPAGHQPSNFTLKLGCNAFLKVDTNEVVFTQN